MTKLDEIFFFFFCEAGGREHRAGGSTQGSTKEQLSEAEMWEILSNSIVDEIAKREAWIWTRVDTGTATEGEIGDWTCSNQTPQPSTETSWYDDPIEAKTLAYQMADLSVPESGPLGLEIE